MSLQARLTLARPARGRSIEGYRAADIVGGLCEAVEGWVGTAVMLGWEPLFFPKYDMI